MYKYPISNDVSIVDFCMQKLLKNYLFYTTFWKKNYKSIFLFAKNSIYDPQTYAKH